MPTVAALLADSLTKSGVDTIFGLPGGENVVFLDAIRRSGIRFVLAHHESSALFMADAYSRLTRKPAVCLTTLGPGATNAVTGVANAYLDRSPILIFTAQTPSSMWFSHTHQVINLSSLYSPITKASFIIEPNNAFEILQTALQTTMIGRPGPVHLQLSDETAAKHVATINTSIISSQKPPKKDSLDKLNSILPIIAEARFPVILAGLGLEPEAPYSSLRVLAETIKAPVIVTPKAKGALADDHPLASGVLGLTHDDPVYRILDKADCILAIGFDVVELVKPWDQSAPLIWLAHWENENPRLPSVIDYVGPLQPAIRYLTQSFLTSSATWDPELVFNNKEDLTNRPFPVPAIGKMLPQEVLKILRDILPRDVITVTDVGSHKILAALEWPSFTPNSYLLSNGLSSMGYGLPAAYAASLSFPGRTVLCLTGDGGFSMNMGELRLLSQLISPVLIVLFNDGFLDLIRSRQIRAGSPVFGTEFTNPNFAGIAGSFGIPHYSVSHPENCALAVKEASSIGRPVFIEAQIDPASYPTTPQS